MESAGRLSPLSGFLLINKPEKISSYDCIRYIQKVIGKVRHCKKGAQHDIKISHMGSLDPFASGLLIIAISRQATKQSQNFLKLDKEYKAVGKLGELTDTLDHTGEIIELCNQNTSKEDIKSAIDTLRGQYKQIPPIFSALKYQGHPLYKLARSKSVSLTELQNITKSKAKLVKIYKLELENYDQPYFKIIAHVSHGTYIRSLINDIAKLAGSCATTYQLIRTKIGLRGAPKFSLDQAVDLYSLINIEDIKHNLIN